MNLKKLTGYILLAAAVITGCDDIMTKSLDIDTAYYPPKLAVAATLDTDSGRLSVWMSAGYSLSHYKDWKPEYEDVFGNGTIRLYKDNEADPVFAFSDLFHLSGSETNYSVSFYGDTTFYSSYFKGYYNTFVGIPARAGSVYRLEVEVEGFPMVTSTSVMPDDPVISSVNLDTATIVTRNRPMNIYIGSGGNWSGWGDRFWPLTIELTDNSPSPDYYLFSISEYWNSSIGYKSLSHRKIGTSNIVLIQDNPAFEAEIPLIDLDGEAYDIYLFDKMTISDVSFANTSANLSLYTPIEWSRPGTKSPGYDPDIHGREILESTTYYIDVKHISQEAFSHYRSTVMHYAAGSPIFAEPVFIHSNMENGWGCFYLYNTKRIRLLEFENYRYPDWWY